MAGFCPLIEHRWLLSFIFHYDSQFDQARGFMWMSIYFATDIILYPGICIITFLKAFDRKHPFWWHWQVCRYVCLKFHVLSYAFLTQRGLLKTVFCHNVWHELWTRMSCERNCTPFYLHLFLEASSFLCAILIAIKEFAYPSGEWGFRSEDVLIRMEKVGYNCKQGCFIFPPLVVWLHAPLCRWHS